jgi:dihydroorotate dehydrogenase
MKILKIEKKKGTPEVILNNESNIFEIRGESYPENSAEFYNPIIKWISEYCKDSSRKLIFNINLTYFNTSSSKALLDIFDILEDFHQKKGKLTVNWYYYTEDESTKENGEEFAEDLAFPFNIIEINN